MKLIGDTLTIIEALLILTDTFPASSISVSSKAK
jgi:hypothetical protein